MGEEPLTEIGQQVKNVIDENARAYFDKAGLSLKYLASLLKKELKAKETKFFQFQGVVISKREVIAWDVRQRARMDAHRLRGDYPADNVQHSGTVNIEVVTGVPRNPNDNED